MGKPADKVIALVLLDNPVLSHADIIPKTRLLYQFYWNQQEPTGSDMIATVGFPEPTRPNFHYSDFPDKAHLNARPPLRKNLQRDRIRIRVDEQYLRLCAFDQTRDIPHRVKLRLDGQYPAWQQVASVERVKHSVNPLVRFELFQFNLPPYFRIHSSTEPNIGWQLEYTSSDSFQVSQSVVAPRSIMWSQPGKPL